MVNNCQIGNISFSSLGNPTGCITSAVSYLFEESSPEDTLPSKIAFDRGEITNFASLKSLCFYSFLILLSTYRYIYTATIFLYAFIENFMSGGNAGNIDNNSDFKNNGINDNHGNNDNSGNNDSNNSNYSNSNLNGSSSRETGVMVNENRIATGPPNTTHHRNEPVINSSTTTNIPNIQNASNSNANVDSSSSSKERVEAEFDDSMRELIRAKEDYLYLLTLYQSMANNLTKNPNPLEMRTSNAEADDLHFDSTAEEFIASQIELIAQVRKARIIKDDSLKELQNLQKIFKESDETEFASSSSRSTTHNNNPVVLFKKDSASQDVFSKADSSNARPVVQRQNSLAQEGASSSAKPYNARPVARPQSNPAPKDVSSKAGPSNVCPVVQPQNNPDQEGTSSSVGPSDTHPVAQSQNSSVSGSSSKTNPDPNI